METLPCGLTKRQVRTVVELLGLVELGTPMPLELENAIRRVSLGQEESVQRRFDAALERGIRAKESEPPVGVPRSMRELTLVPRG